MLGDHGKNLYRERLLAKFLQTDGRSDIPVGIGADVNTQGDGTQAAWVKDYNLNAYPGRVQADGVVISLEHTDTGTLVRARVEAHRLT